MTYCTHQELGKFFDLALYYTTWERKLEFLSFFLLSTENSPKFKCKLHTLYASAIFRLLGGTLYRHHILSNVK